MQIKLCECECGQPTLIAKRTDKSCGTVKGQPRRFIQGHGARLNLKSTLTHGMNGSPEDKAYRAAKQRCMNRRNPDWVNYGGRGIQFNFLCFEQFVAELGPRPSPYHSLDRKNNNGHYEPGNVRWATPSEQQANRRRWSREAA